MQQIEQETGKRPPVGIKLDVEGEEYALVPAMITNGALCDLTMVYMEAHWLYFRSAAGVAVNMTFEEIQTVFDKMRTANPRCGVQLLRMDDEAYYSADKAITLPVGIDVD